MADDLDTDRTDDAPPPDDIRSALTAALAEQEAPPSDAPERPERQPADRDDASQDRQERTDSRARGPDGKFVRAEGEEPSAPAPRPGTRPAPTESTQPEAKPEPADDPLAKATAKWSQADRDMLKGLPEPAREFVLRRQRDADADYTRKTQEVAREREQLQGFRQTFEPVAQIFAPYREQMQARGFTPESMIRAWHNVEQRLVQGDGVNVVKGLVEGYRLPVDQVARALGINAASATGPDGQPVPEAPPQPQIPPELMQRLTAHENWIIQQEQHHQQQQQEAQRSHSARVMSDIETFASATDKDGAPLHPHFREVEEDMTRLVHAARASGGPTPSLEQLYDQAVWANTSTRTQLLDRERAAIQAQRVAAEETRRREARAHADRSRRAGSSVTGSPGNGSQAPRPGRSNGSVRDDLMAAVDELDA